MHRCFILLAILTDVLAITATAPSETLPPYLKRPATFTPKPFFPMEPFKEFYDGFGPSQMLVQPQPKVTDPLNGYVYPLNLTNPATIPEVSFIKIYTNLLPTFAMEQANLVDPVVFGPSVLTGRPNGPLAPTANLSTPQSRALATQTINQIIAVISSNNGSCDKCIAGLLLAQNLAKNAPWEVPTALIQLCTKYDYSVSFPGMDDSLSLYSVL
jgi:sphingomyelin phosphodiesterase